MKLWVKSWYSMNSRQSKKKYIGIYKKKKITTKITDGFIICY